MGERTYGEVGYEAYGDHQGWKNFAGDPMPLWRDVPEDIQQAWERAAIAIMDYATGPEG